MNNGSKPAFKRTISNPTPSMIEFDEVNNSSYENPVKNIEQVSSITYQSKILCILYISKSKTSFVQIS